MAKFIAIEEYEMINAEHIVGLGLNPAEGNRDPKINGVVSLTISLTNNVCVTIYDYRNIKRFFEDLFYHFPACSQPDTYAKIYRTFLKMINEENENGEEIPHN